MISVVSLSEQIWVLNSLPLLVRKESEHQKAQDRRAAAVIPVSSQQQYLSMQENIFEDDFLDITLLKFILMVKHKGSAMVIIPYLVILWACEIYNKTVKSFYGRRDKTRALYWWGLVNFRFKVVGLVSKYMTESQTILDRERKIICRQSPLMNICKEINPQNAGNPSDFQIKHFKKEGNCTLLQWDPINTLSVMEGYWEQSQYQARFMGVTNKMWQLASNLLACHSVDQFTKILVYPSSTEVVQKERSLFFST